MCNGHSHQTERARSIRCDCDIFFYFVLRYFISHFYFSFLKVVYCWMNCNVFASANNDQKYILLHHILMDERSWMMMMQSAVAATATLSSYCNALHCVELHTMRLNNVSRYIKEQQCTIMMEGYVSQRHIISINIILKKKVDTASHCKQTNGKSEEVEKIERHRDIQWGWAVKSIK